jgi:hypothetical protein
VHGPIKTLYPGVKKVRRPLGLGHGSVFYQPARRSGAGTGSSGGPRAGGPSTGQSPASGSRRCHREWKEAARRDGKLVLLCVIHARQQARKARGIRPDWMDDDRDTTLFPPWVRGDPSKPL